MSLQWVAVDLRTGVLLADLPDLDVGATGVTHTIGQYDSTTAQLPVAASLPANWLYATRPMGSMIVGLGSDSRPRYGGIVLQRQRPGGKPVQLSVSTPEYYLTRRFVRDTRQYPTTDRVFIAQDLLTRYVLDPTVGGTAGRNGIPLRIAADGLGQVVDGDYKDTDDRSIYSIFGDLGMEWSFGLEWQHNPERITLVCYLSERIGIQAATVFGPPVTLDWPGNLDSVLITEDYGEGKGANDVMSTSTGKGDVRPQSDHQTAIAADMPTVEMRGSAGSNITRRALLNAYASSVLARTRLGSVAYSATISATRPEADAIDIGDDVGLDLSGPEYPDHPRSVQRAAGLVFGASTVTPVLAGGDA